MNYFSTRAADNWMAIVFIQNLWRAMNLDFLSTIYLEVKNITNVYDLFTASNILKMSVLLML